MRFKKSLCSLFGFVALALVAFLFFRGLTRSAEPPPPHLRLAADNSALVSWLAIIAEKRHFWAEERVNVEFQKFSSGRDAVQSLLARRADAATLADFPFMLASHQQDGLRIFATIAESGQHMQIVGDRKAGVSSLADLSGKRVGVTVGSAGQYLLATAVQSAGIPIEKLEISNFSPPELAAAMSRRQLAAASTWQPFVIQIETALGSDAVVLSDTNSYRMTFNLVAFASDLNQNSEGFKRLLRALERAEDYVKTNRSSAVAILSEETSIPQDVLSKILVNYQFQLTLNDGLTATLEKQDGWAAATKLVTSTLPRGEWRQRINSTVLSEVDPAAVHLSPSKQ